MQIEDRIEKEEKLSEQATTDMFMAICLGKDITEKVHTSRGDFKIKYPRAKDLEAIGRLTAYRLNGLNAQSFDPNFYNLIQQIATLDVVVLEGPAWYENAKKENMNFGWGDIPIQSYIQEVYAKAYEFRYKVQEQLEGNKDTADQNMAAVSSVKTSNEPGLFDGISN